MLLRFTGRDLAFSIFGACFEPDITALLRGYAELLRPESNCAVNVRMAALNGAHCSPFQSKGRSQGCTCWPHFWLTGVVSGMHAQAWMDS